MNCLKKLFVLITILFCQCWQMKGIVIGNETTLEEMPKSPPILKNNLGQNLTSSSI